MLVIQSHEVRHAQLLAAQGRPDPQGQREAAELVLALAWQLVSRIDADVVAEVATSIMEGLSAGQVADVLKTFRAGQLLPEDTASMPWLN